MNGDMNLEIGNKYKWKHETQRLVYVGKCGVWYQFVLENTDEICVKFYSKIYL